MITKTTLLILIGLSLLVGCLQDSPSPPAPRRFILDNGLTLLLLEEHSAPVVALQAWVKAGSADEPEKLAGISHLIEHMLFKGTKSRGLGEIAQEIEGKGGEINAYTSFDQTVYHIVIASRYIETGLNVIADALQHPTFDPKELKKEKEVVLEEIRRAEDIPESKLSRTLFALSYQRHPYGRPIIGYQKTVVSLNRKEVWEFYKNWYMPENTYLIIAGDFSTAEILPKVKGAFQNWPGLSPVEATRPSRTSEPDQDELRITILQDNVKECYLDLAFHIPSISGEDLYAIDVISTLLGEGESSRLYQEIKAERELVNSIFAYAYTPKDPGLLLISSTLEREQVEKALTQIITTIYRLKYDRIPSPELEKAKTNLESHFIYQGETAQGQARQLGFFEIVAGDISFKERYLKGVRGVSSEELRKVARKYLNNSNLSIGLLLPEDGPPLDKNKIVSLVKEVQSDTGGEKQHRNHSIQSESKGITKTEEAGVTKTLLNNGMTLLIKESHTSPIVALRAVFLGGLRFEDETHNGIYNFIAEMLTTGTKSRSAREIAEQIDRIAGRIDGFSGRNSFGISALFLSRFFDSGLELFTDIILNPAFDKVELGKKKKDILAAIKNREDDLAHLTFDLFAQTLYTRHPYRMTPLGTKDSIERIERADLIDFYQSSAVPENLVLVIVGDIKAEEAEKKVSRYFQDFRGNHFSPPELPLPLPLKKIRSSVKYLEKEQAHIILGFLGTTLDSDDRYPLEILNTVLSGQGGRLFLELRDKESLAYVVFSFSLEGLEPGYLGTYIACHPEKLDQAISGIKRELNRLREDKITTEELERAKNYLVGTYEIGLQRNSALATELAFNERYGLGWDYYQKYPARILEVSAEDVLLVAKKYIQLDRYALTVIRPKKTNPK
ncbi:MAG: insulinase family protein [Deltaproteobacteria bacterium]|nr:MAG: insulinase family protein [Deltaproteobacteria bacterium]